MNHHGPHHRRPNPWRTAAAILAIITSGAISAAFAWTYTQSLPWAAVILSSSFALAIHRMYDHLAASTPDQNSTPEPPAPADPEDHQ